jgi:L-rhamnose mutarotase
MKKYDAVIDDKKTIPFGARGISDYTIHRDDERKERYINRHKKNEDWNNIYTAGFWSRWILWNKPSISESIRDTNNRFKNVNIKNKII